MQQFTVPQFIDVEDKIIGPVTTRQFVIMLSTCILIAICYKIFDFELFIVIGLVLFGIGGVFSFLKINGRPFHFFVLNFIETLKRPPIRIWSNKSETPFMVGDDVINIDVQKPAPGPHKAFSRSRLAQLSLIVDTHGAYREGEEDDLNIVSGIK